jgi:hypothetical protein
MQEENRNVEFIICEETPMARFSKEELAILDKILGGRMKDIDVSVSLKKETTLSSQPLIEGKKE